MVPYSEPGYQFQLKTNVRFNWKKNKHHLFIRILGFAPSFYETDDGTRLSGNFLFS